MQRIKDFAAYLAVRCLVASLQILPEAKADAFCRGAAWLLSGPVPVRRKILKENLGRVFPHASKPERRAITRAMWYHLILMVCEIAWAPRRLHRCNWHRHILFPHAQKMLRVLLDRRAAVLVTGHFGNFELGGYVTGLMGIDTVTIARRLDNQYLHSYVTQFREAKGQRLLDKRGCAPEVDRHLAQGGILSLLADQHAGPKGCWTPFLGHQASCHKALALFTLSGDAPMAVGYTVRCGEPMRFEMGCTGITDPRDQGPECQGVRALTEWYNRRLEDAIAIAPDQYWWVHRRWREPPTRKRGSRAAKHPDRSAA